MKFLRNFNKLLLLIIYILIFFFVIYLSYLINSKEPRNKDTRRISKSIFNVTISQHIFNDYREQYLLNTQFIKLNYKRINLDFLKLNSCYFGDCYTFYLEQYQDNLIERWYGVFRYGKFDK